MRSAPIAVPEEPPSIEEQIRAAATKYDIPYESFYKTLECESDHFRVLTGQSEVVRPDGTREPSWGIAQFYIPSDLRTSDGSIVTKEVAINPIEAIDTAAYQFSIGNARRWTCYRDLYL